VVQQDGYIRGIKKYQDQKDKVTPQGRIIKIYGYEEDNFISSNGFIYLLFP
jgi:hypothetical protein